MIAYKYTRGAHLSSILEQGRFAFPNIAALNDPFESSIETSIDFIRTNLRQPVSIFQNASLRLWRSPTPGEPYDPVQRENRAISQYNEQLHEEERLNRDAEEALTLFQQAVGVLALSKDPMNIVLWAHYAENGTGFCVGVDFSHAFFSSYRPRTSPLDTFEALFRIAEVRYAPERPPYARATPSDFVENAFFTKYETWSYERELRLLRPLAECETRGPVPVLEFPLEAIREVYLGPRCQPDLMGHCLQIVPSLRHAEFFKVESIERTYSLRKKPLVL